MVINGHTEQPKISSQSKNYNKYLKNEQECNIGFKTRGDSRVL